MSCKAAGKPPRPRRQVGRAVSPKGLGHPTLDIWAERERRAPALKACKCQTGKQNCQCQILFMTKVTISYLIGAKTLKAPF